MYAELFLRGVFNMAERWKIYLMIAFITLTIIPIAMVAAKMYVPVWALIAGHCGMLVVGFICGEWSQGEA
ncbi:MAG: hypothetical protein E7L09_05965 [Enterobacteriaceae bacterium]|nr:hypothetical protein [Enterobacteriaceae bacterium]